MHVTLSEWRESASCGWCEKDKECVSVSFDDGFLKQATLCWTCLQKAVKVRSRQEEPPPEARPRSIG